MQKEIIGRHYNDIDTPALLLDMNAVERNINKMADFFVDKKCKLRPHVKTHKLPLIGKMQVSSGAIGVTCATLDEAEAFIDIGIKEILIANQIVGGEKIKRMVKLAAKSDLIVCVDDISNAENISNEAKESGCKISVLVEVNVGLNRCGVLPGKDTLNLVNRLSELEFIEFIGLMGYEGGLFINDPEEKKKRCAHSNELLVETSKLVEKNGFNVRIVSAGGSNTYYQTGVFPGITEIQPGSYVTMDEHNSMAGLDFEQAVTVLATIISKPESNRIIVDAGRKALSVDEGLPVALNKSIKVTKLSEEHGHLEACYGNISLSVGDKIQLVPSHGCTTIPLYNNYVLTRNGIVEGNEKLFRR